MNVAVWQWHVRQLDVNLIHCSSRCLSSSFSERRIKEEGKGKRDRDQDRNREGSERERGKERGRYSVVFEWYYIVRRREGGRLRKGK